MTKKHIAESFQKSYKTIANNILTDIWHNSVADNLLVINDFVQQKSYNVLSLNAQDIRWIHRINAKHSLRKSTCNKEFELVSDRANMCMENLNLQDASTTGSKYNVPMFMSPWTPDTLITDDLLDSFEIPLGNKKERLKTFYKHSETLYNYLCYYIGSERIVKFRRWFVRKKYLQSVIKGVSIEVSGSKAEGLDMKGSDLDVMFIVDNFDEILENFVVSTQNEDFTPIVIQYKSLNMSPGYVLVEIVTDDECIYLPSSMFKGLMFSINHNLKESYFKTTIHGPSLSQKNNGEDIDSVPCLRSKQWPEIAKEWIVRERKFGWPSQEMINDIVKQGCCIVPVGTKANHVNENDWRLSFSLAEKNLIFSFNHTQVLVYGLLKLILKEIVKPRKEVSDLLCSYFLKTTLFWIIEETHASIWKPQLIFLCFYLCLERLIQFIAEENCPNYFVRNNNMIAGRLSISGKDKLLQIFCDISKTRLSFILESETMKKLRYCIKDHLKIFQYKLLQKRKDLMEIIRYILEIIRHTKYIAWSPCLFKSVPIAWQKSLFQVPIVRTFVRKEVCHFLDKHRIGNNNKKAYRLQKLQLCLLCSGCNTDLSAGKLTLASWLYNNGKFNESLEFTDLALEFSKYRMFHVGLATTTELPFDFVPKPDSASEGDLIQTLLYFATTDVQFMLHSCLLPSEVNLVLRPFYGDVVESIRIRALVSFLPEYYSHFLRFLCLNKLGETKRSHDALIEMQCVKLLGSKWEQVLHLSSKTILRIVGNIVENRTENEWRHFTDLTYILQHCSACNLEGVDLSTLGTTIVDLEEFGIDSSVVPPLIVKSC